MTAVYLQDEQYDRNGTFMLSYACPDEGEGRYRFVLHTTSIEAVNHIAECFCIVGSYTVWEQSHIQFTMTVAGHFAWELITSLLDEVLLGDVWVKAIDEVVA